MLLVLGATGYLGSALVAELVRLGEDVRAVVRDPRRASVLPAGVERVAADMDDPVSLRAALTGCDGVFHLAGLVRETGEATRTANVAATRLLLDLASATGVRRVVLTSSVMAAVDSTGFAGECAPAATPLADPYLQAKVESERLVFAAAESGQEALVVSPGSIYGPSPAGPYSYNTLLLAAARGELTSIVDARIGWVLAEDVAVGHVLAYRHGEAGRRYILSGGVESFATVLNTYAELVDSPHRVTPLPPGSVLAGDVPMLARRSQDFGAVSPVRIDDARARALGFAPRDVGEGLRRTAAWLGR